MARSNYKAQFRLEKRCSIRRTLDLKISSILLRPNSKYDNNNSVKEKDLQEWAI